VAGRHAVGQPVAVRGGGTASLPHDESGDLHRRRTGVSDLPPDSRDGGVATALRFLAAVRRDPALRERVAALDLDAGLPALATIAGAAGFRITVRDLRAAHAQDWGLRRALLAHRDQATASAATTAAVVNAPSSST
jgi:predicted ribosomally synthesized peptide with nif11-like leader